ncbi:MAG: hypothetical protein BroJett042_30000 [Bacteroidota bacterium]|nr:MAG: hypothetical protein BroJett042_30000 [Bacteroidota bacterium]
MYDLHSLGWYGFQELCLTVTREVFGQTVTAFLSSHDGGRDGSFTGEWQNNNGETWRGKFVFQCKYSNRPHYNLKLSDLSDELPKADRLAKQGLCNIYVLITNAGVSGSLEEKINSKLKSYGISNVLVLGSTWLFQTIRENKRLRRLVPRVYGLGDLSQILDERVYVQGRALLDSLKDELSKVVITDAYQRAAKALDKHGFVLLIGEPAAGKTTIASLLAMGALDQWQASTMKLETPEKVIHHWNPDDPNQFFWVDDAFGVTQYERSLVREWNHHIAQVRAMLNKGARIVMTSRDYIYNAARSDLKATAFPLLNESQVVIDVHNLTLDEKRQMLYNHMKLGSQPPEFRKKIKPHLEGVAKSKRFIPETARRLGSPFFTKNLYISEWHLEEFVNKQEDFLIEVVGGLDQDCQAALALIYMNSGRLKSPIELKAGETDAIQRMGSSLGGCTHALSAMNGSLVQFDDGSEIPIWRFKHPTVGDAFSSFVVKSPELIEIYLQGCPVEKLLEQVTCGKMGVKRAIVVPKSYFPLVLKRLKAFTSTKKYKDDYLSKWGAKRQVHEFLSFRCTKDFLIEYIKENPNIIDQVSKPGLMLDTVSEVHVACKLNEYNLLPEEQRKLFVQTVSKYAVNGDDLYALRSEKIQSIFRAKELEALKEEIKLKVIPKLEEMCTQRQESFDIENDSDAEFFMQSIIETLETIEEQFRQDVSITGRVQKQLQVVKDWIEENTMENSLEDREKLSNAQISMQHESERSIFDDIDIA